MLKTQIKQKQKTIIETITNFELSYIQFNHTDNTFSVIADLLDENNNIVEQKRYVYSIDEFKIFDRLIRRIFKDEKIELLDE